VVSFVMIIEVDDMSVIGIACTKESTQAIKNATIMNCLFILLNYSSNDSIVWFCKSRMVEARVKGN